MFNAVFTALNNDKYGFEYVMNHKKRIVSDCWIIIHWLNCHEFIHALFTYLIYSRKEKNIRKIIR